MGIRRNLKPVLFDYTVFLNGGWQDWSEFSENGIAISGGGNSLDTEIDRQWDDTWYARIGFAHDIDERRAYALGVSYDSSPVKNKHRTFDLPVDEYYKLSAAYTSKGKRKLNYAWVRHSCLWAMPMSTRPVRVCVLRANSTRIIFCLPGEAFGTLSSPGTAWVCLPLAGVIGSLTITWRST